MEILIDSFNGYEDPMMNMDGAMFPNVNPGAFKSMFVDSMPKVAIKEILNTLRCDSLSDLCFFVAPWKTPLQKGYKYDQFYQELRQGRKVQEKNIGGTRIIVCMYYNTPYIQFFNQAAGLHPDFIVFVKGEQPSI